MSQTSIRLHSDCHLGLRCACHADLEASRPNLLATCGVYILPNTDSGDSEEIQRCCGVYDSGYVVFNEDREESSSFSQFDISQSGYDLVRYCISGAADQTSAPGTLFALRDEKGHLVCHFRARDRTTSTILSVAIQQAEKLAHLFRTPDVVFSAKVYEGLVLLKPQYLALFKDRMFAQGSSNVVAKDPKKEASVYCSLDEIEFRPYGNDGRGMHIERKRLWKKDVVSYLWFITAEERSAFFALTTFPHQLDSIMVSANQCTGANMMKATNQECSHQLMRIVDSSDKHFSDQNRSDCGHFAAGEVINVQAQND